MSRYAIVDAAHLIHRARFVVQGDAFTKAGMALHIIFKSLRKLFREQQCDHVVLCVEGRSWRHDVYPAYKSRRRLERAAKMTPQDREENEVFNKVYEDFVSYMAEKTRVTVLQSDGIEGDDWIARWVQLHPKDEHVILSGDSDLIQLLDDHVTIYNGIDDRLVTTKGVFNGDGEELVFSVDPSSGKIKVKETVAAARKAHAEAEKERKKNHLADEKERRIAWERGESRRLAEDSAYVVKPFVETAFEPREFSFEIEPEWWKLALFVKIIRGDTGDSIFSSYPGVRYKGAKGKIGIREAWDDRAGQGFSWNNFMLSPWDKLISVDSDGNKTVKQVRVLDEYKINESLIDLTKQPENIKDLMDTVIIQAIQKEPVGNIGMHFLKYCHANDLPALSREAAEHAKYLAAPYTR